MEELKRKLKRNEIEIECLCEKVCRLEKENKELYKVTADKTYRKFCLVREQAMVEALKEYGIEFSFKEGDVIFCEGHLDLVFKVFESHIVTSATLYDYSCDCEHFYEISTKEHGYGEVLYEDNPRPASDYEVILFDYELKKNGYKRTKEGRVVKI